MGLPVFVRANGKMFTRNSTAIRLNGIIRLTDVDSIEWSDERPAELVLAMNDGGAPLGQALGNYNTDASISLYADYCTLFEAAVLAANPTALNDLSACTFSIAISMMEDVRLRTVMLVGCRIVGRPSRTVGNDGSAIVKQYALKPTLILENGLALVNLTPSL